MVNLALGETARLAFFSASFRLFYFLKCETENLKRLHEKIETLRHGEPLKNKSARPLKFNKNFK